jgi:hypothetical protein
MAGAERPESREAFARSQTLRHSAAGQGQNPNIMTAFVRLEASSQNLACLGPIFETVRVPLDLESFNH